MPRAALVSASVIVLVIVGAPRAQVRQAAVVASPTDSSPFFRDITEAASLARRVDVLLANARERLAALLAVTEPRTVENTLAPLDEILGRVAFATGLVNVVRELHPDPAMRAAAEPLALAVAGFATQLSVNRDVFAALSRVPDRGLPDDTRYYLSVTLANYRRSGVDRDDAARARIEKLRETLQALTQDFQRNIREGVRRFQVDPVDLEGLPPDFIASHAPDATGRVTLSTEAPDQQPVMNYARRADLRRRMASETSNVAYPQNIDVLKRLLATRAAIAAELGFANWADYDTDDRMTGSGRAAGAFIDRIVEVTGRKAREDYERLLERKRRDDPQAAAVYSWDVGYYTELVRQSGYQFDSQSMRPYFPYEQVRDGVLSVVRRLFGLEFARAAGVPTWHPSVEVFEVSEAGRPVGRVYLDLHPRAGKAGGGASSLTVRSGVTSRQLPEIVVVARFPGGTAGDPGLMTHAQVVTFFHEFGHAVHAISSGGQAWHGLARIRERDFIEAPSQMLEEWAEDPDTLATFARHHQTGQPIPADLLRQMQRASGLGRGLSARNQMVFARLSLALHDRSPVGVDPIAVYHEIGKQYLPVALPEDNRLPASFTHLANPNYTSSYYTYMWSLVIAKDLFSTFDSGNLLDGERGRAYRRAILVPGGSRPAKALVETYLGRSSSADAWERWMNGVAP